MRTSVPTLRNTERAAGFRAAAMTGWGGTGPARTVFIRSSRGSWARTTGGGRGRVLVGGGLVGEERTGSASHLLLHGALLSAELRCQGALRVGAAPECAHRMRRARLHCGRRARGSRAYGRQRPSRRHWPALARQARATVGDASGGNRGTAYGRRQLQACCAAARSRAAFHARPPSARPTRPPPCCAGARCQASSVAARPRSPRRPPSGAPLRPSSCDAQASTANAWRRRRRRRRRSRRASLPRSPRAT